MSVAAAFELPASRLQSPADAPALNWGIMGPGSIAGTFAESLSKHTRQNVAGVASRSMERATRFADLHGIARAHGSYEALAADTGIDIVYISTPNPFHFDCALLALNAGKHVLIEKPLAMNASEARELVKTSKERGLFLMEAMWPRFLPAADVIRQVLETGMLGEIHSLIADLGEYFPPDPAHRLYSPALGGGALLDLGVYLVSFASFVMGPQSSVQATGSFTDTGVDGQLSATLRGPGNSQAQLFTTLAARTPTTAFIAGSKGTLTIDSPFYMPGRLTLRLHGAGGNGASGGERSSAAQEFAVSSPSDALCFEAAEAARVIAGGGTESPLLPVAESLRIMETLDEIRIQLHNSR